LKSKVTSPEFQNHLWILLATAIAAPFAQVLALITTRLIGLEPAGMIAYAAAVSGIFVVFVIFSSNQIQMVDVREEFSFREYLGFRTVTSAFATAGLALFLIIARFDRNQAAVIFLYYFIFLIDSYANVFMTDFHQKGKIRIMGRMRASGFGIALVAFILAVFITRDVVLPLLAAGVLLLIIYVLWIWLYRGHFGAIRAKIEFSAIRRLIVAVLPILVLTFIMTYLGYAPNIYLGEFYSLESVAVYAILITPAALFQILLHTLLFGAPLPHTSEAYASGELKRFSMRIHALLLLAAAAAVPFLALAYFFGIPLLTWLYNTDFSPYLRQLMLLCAGGLFTTAAPIIGMALIIMRRQKAYMYSFIAVGAIAGPLVGFLVWSYGLDGAVLSNIVVFAPLTVLVYVVFRRALRYESMQRQ